MKELYFRYGDLYPDNPNIEFHDIEKRMEMMKIRERMMDETEDLRKSLNSPNGEWIIGDNLECMKFDFRRHTHFKNYLSMQNLLFKTKEDCQMVIDEMKKVL